MAMLRASPLYRCVVGLAGAGERLGKCSTRDVATSASRVIQSVKSLAGSVIRFVQDHAQHRLLARQQGIEMALLDGRRILGIACQAGVRTVNGDSELRFGVRVTPLRIGLSLRGCNVQVMANS